MPPRTASSPAFFDERHPRVTRPNQGRDERVPIRDLADFEVDRTTAHDFARGHPQRERRPGCHRDGCGFDPRIRLRARQPAIQDVHPLGDQKRLRGEALVGMGVVGWDTRARAHLPQALRAQRRDPGRGRRRPWRSGRRRARAHHLAARQASAPTTAPAPPRKPARRTAPLRSAHPPGDVVEILVDRLASRGLLPYGVAGPSDRSCARAARRNPRRPDRATGGRESTGGARCCGECSRSSTRPGLESHG